MRDIAIMKTSLLILTAVCTSLAAEDNLILRALRANPSNVRRVRGVSGPSISATSKPPCPSYISCPYPPYPRPTTKQPNQEDSVTTPSTTSTSEKAVVEYFGPENTEELSSIASASASSGSDGPVKVNKPGVTNGPSISATSKPPCPGYITCPYPPYPRPTTKPPPREEKTTVSPDVSTSEKAVVEYFGPEKEDAPDTLASVSASASSTTSDGPVRVNKPGVTHGPSISATSKPPCPSYITCPYPPYPRPTTKPPAQEEKTTTAPAVSTSEKVIVEYFGPEKENAPDMLANAPAKPSGSTVDGPVRGNKPGVTNGPSIPATSKPPCPSYITCPYPPYPKPTTKSPLLGALSPIVTDNPPVEYFAPETNTSPEDLQIMNESKLPQSTETLYTETVDSATQENSDNSITTDGQAENKPVNTEASIVESHVNSMSTERNDGSQYSPMSESSKVPSSTGIPDGWHFPGPSNADPVTARNPPSTDNASEIQTVGQLEYSADPALTTVTRRPAISATQKPQCPFYASCPWIYPKPTTASPLLNKIFSPPNELSSNSGSLSNKNTSPTNNVQTSTPDIVPFVGGDVSSHHQSSPNPVDLGNQGVYLPIYSYVYGFDPYVQNSYYYNRRPSILLTPKPFWPSYLKNPWVYPRPFGSQYAYEQDLSVSSDKKINSNTSTDEEERDESNSDVSDESD